MTGQNSKHSKGERKSPILKECSHGIRYLLRGVRQPVKINSKTEIELEILRQLRSAGQEGYGHNDLSTRVSRAIRERQKEQLGTDSTKQETQKGRYTGTGPVVMKVRIRDLKKKMYIDTGTRRKRQGTKIRLILTPYGEELLQKYDILNQWLTDHKARYEEMKNKVISGQIPDGASNELLDDAVVGVYNIFRAIATLVKLPQNSADYLLPLVKQITKELGDNMRDLKREHKAEFDLAMKYVTEGNLNLYKILENQQNNNRVLFIKSNQLVLLNDLGIAEFQT